MGRERRGYRSNKPIDEMVDEWFNGHQGQTREMVRLNTSELRKVIVAASPLFGIVYAARSRAASLTFIVM